MKRILVLADLKKGGKLYVNFMRIRYSSVELQRRSDLKGSHVFARSDPDDLRVIALLDAEGAEICRARGEGRWGVLPHASRTTFQMSARAFSQNFFGANHKE